MARVEKDEVREERIALEAIVDANGPEEQAMGWYYYLDDKISTPFKAKCITKRTISPLEVGEKVEVLGMLAEDECEHEMFARVRWQGRELGVPWPNLAWLKRMKLHKKQSKIGIIGLIGGMSFNLVCGRGLPFVVGSGVIMFKHFVRV